MGKYVTVPFAGVSANTSALPLPYAATRIVTEKPLTAQVHHVYTFTSNLLNQFAYSYARLAIPISSATADGQYPTKAGLAGLPAGQASNAFPTINFGTTSSAQSGTNAPQSWAGTNSQAFDETANTYVVKDSVQWVKGKHTLTMGGQFQWLQDNYTSPDDRSNATFNFTNSEMKVLQRPGPALLDHDVVDISAEEQVLLTIEYSDLGTALARILPQLRSVLQVTVLDGLTTREAARLLGIPEGTVKTRLARARAALREEMA